MYNNKSINMEGKKYMLTQVQKLQIICRIRKKFFTSLCKHWRDEASTSNCCLPTPAQINSEKKYTYDGHSTLKTLLAYENQRMFLEDSKT